MPPTFRSAGTWAFTVDSVPASPTLSPGAPSGVAIGDCLILISETRSITATATTPTGWTLVSGFPKRSGTASGGSFYVWVRIATGGSDDTPQVSWSGLTTGTSGDTTGAGLFCYQGLSTTLDGTVQSSDLAAQTTTSVIPAFTTGTNNSMVIGIAMKLLESASQTSTVATFTERADNQTTNGTGHTIEVSEKLQTTAGSSGTATVTWSATTSARALTASFGLQIAVPTDEDPPTGMPFFGGAMAAAATALLFGVSTAAAQNVMAWGGADEIIENVPIEEYSPLVINPPFADLWRTVTPRPDTFVEGDYPILSSDGAGTILRDWSGVRYNISGDDIFFPLTDDDPGGVVTVPPIIPPVVPSPNWHQDEVVSIPPSIGGGVLAHWSGVRYNFSGDEIVTPPPSQGGGVLGYWSGVRYQYAPSDIVVPSQPLVEDEPFIPFGGTTVAPDYISQNIPIPSTWDYEDILPPVVPTHDDQPVAVPVLGIGNLVPAPHWFVPDEIVPPILVVDDDVPALTSPTSVAYVAPAPHWYSQDVAVPPLVVPIDDTPRFPAPIVAINLVPSVHWYDQDVFVPPVVVPIEDTPRFPAPVIAVNRVPEPHWNSQDFATQLFTGGVDDPWAAELTQRSRGNFEARIVPVPSLWPAGSDAGLFAAPVVCEPLVGVITASTKTAAITASPRSATVTDSTKTATVTDPTKTATLTASTNANALSPSEREGEITCSS